jgi:hypothetical protein
MHRLRPELLRYPQPDGGLDLLDLLFERLVHLDADEAAQLAAGAPALAPRLASLLLTESELIDSMRQSAWAARARAQPAEAPAPAVDGDWEEARRLPPPIADDWRVPERWRRLAEERAAGRRYLMLPGLVDAATAARLRAAVEALPRERMDTEWVHAERHLCVDGELPDWLGCLAAPSTRRLVGAVLGVALPEAIVANVWRLGRGDWFAVHPDGRLYRGTISLGLCDGWRADDGGAIAFGVPRADGLEVRERWLPHAGDACLFAPDRATWHAVEPVRADRSRWSITSWWRG